MPPALGLQQEYWFGLFETHRPVMKRFASTSWSRSSEATANVLGPLLGFEVLTAFFLEASFLGIMLFGRARVDERLHFLAACVVAGDAGYH